MVKQQQQKTNQAQHVVWQVLVIAVAASASAIGCGTAPSALDAATWKTPPAQFRATLSDACTRAEEPELGACIGLIQLHERSAFPDNDGLQPILERACSLGYEPSCVDAVRNTISGDNPAKDRAGVERIIASCDRGYAPACIAAGSMLSWFPAETTQGLPSAEALYDQGCTKGDSTACLQSTLNFESPETWTQSLGAQSKACALGNKAACIQHAQLISHTKASVTALKDAAAAVAPLCEEGSAAACSLLLVNTYRVASPEKPPTDTTNALIDRLCTLDRYECANIADQVSGYLYNVSDWPFDPPADAHPYTAEAIDPALGTRAYKTLCETYDTQNSGYYCYRYATFLEGADKTPILERGCENGDNDACIALVDATTDTSRQESLLLKTCERGHQSSCIALADRTTDATRKDEFTPAPAKRAKGSRAKTACASC